MFVWPDRCVKGGFVLSLSPKMSMGGADAFLRLPDRERTFSSRWLIDT